MACAAVSASKLHSTGLHVVSAGGGGSVRLFIVSVTGSRMFVGCQPLSSRRVDDWVSTYHSWEQPRCPYVISNLKAPAHIYRFDPDPPPTQRQVLQRPTPRPVASSSIHPIKRPRLGYVTTLPEGASAPRRPRTGQAPLGLAETHWIGGQI